MKKQLLKLAVIAAACSFFALQSCDDEDDDPVETTPEQFVADNNTFAGWDTWTLVETITEPGSALGGAHGGQDSSFTRKIYIKDNQQKVNGEYPKGTLIMKHSYNEDMSVNMYTSMAKRGEDFNTEGGGWEWFMTEANGAIGDDGEMRGADLLDGMCQSCHNSVASKDYVFTDN